MKKTKIIALLSAGFMCTQVVNMPGITIKEVKAEGLIQSDIVISKKLHHEHTNEACYECIWIPCGGSWGTNFEPYVNKTVYFCSNNHNSTIVNGVPLYSIHSEWEGSYHSGVHAGEYKVTKTCELSDIGELKVEKINDGENIKLVAAFDDPEGIITDYHITWSGEGINQDGEQLFIKRNGAFTANLEWYDSKTNSWMSDSIIYNDTSFPIELRFKDGDTIIGTKEISYGGILPNAPLKLKVGYIFDGYTYNGSDIYDENLVPYGNISTKWEKEYVDIMARYIPKEYDIHYKIGEVDKTIHVVFGDSYDPIVFPWNDDESGIDMPANFDGLSVEGHKIYDKYGNPISVSWDWDVNDGAMLTEEYVKAEDLSDKRSENNRKESDDQAQNKVLEVITDNSIINIPTEKSVSNNSVSANNIANEESNSSENDKITAISVKNTDSNINESFVNYYRNFEHYNFNLESQNVVEDSSDYDETDSTVDADILMAIPDKKNLAIVESNEAKMVEERKEKFEKIVKIAATVSLATFGAGAAIYGLMWYLLMLYKSAEVYTYDKEKKRVKMGKSIIHKNNDGYMIRITQKMLDNSETGRFEVAFTGSFFEKGRNRLLTIILGKNDRKVSDIVKPIVYVNAYRD